MKVVWATFSLGWITLFASLSFLWPEQKMFCFTMMGIGNGMLIRNLFVKE